MIGHAHAVGVPRGGLIVLGMLSYVLDLRHGQLEGMPPDVPLLLVDDIALTGNRLHRFLQANPSRNVVVATLFSHPTLREAIVRDEPRVTAFVSAYDLNDHARERRDHEKRRARRTGKRYWSGQTDHVCFPWCEPDMAVWNPKTESFDDGLRFVPPDWCLKNKHLEVASETSVYRQPEPTGPIKPQDSAFFGQVGESTIVANPDADVCIELKDTGAAIWHAMIKMGRREDIVDSLLQEYDIDRASLTSHVDQFLRQLEKNNLVSLKYDA